MLYLTQLVVGSHRMFDDRLKGPRSAISSKSCFLFSSAGSTISLSRFCFLLLQNSWRNSVLGLLQFDRFVYLICFPLISDLLISAMKVFGVMNREIFLKQRGHHHNILKTNGNQ